MDGAVGVDAEDRILRQGAIDGVESLAVGGLLTCMNAGLELLCLCFAFEEQDERTSPFVEVLMQLGNVAQGVVGRLLTYTDESDV